MLGWTHKSYYLFKARICERKSGGQITKILKVAKPTFRFGNFQEFCENSIIAFFQSQNCAKI